MKNKNDYLKTATDNFVSAAPPTTRLTNPDQTTAWFARHEIVYPTMFTLEGEAIGFKKEGVDAVVALAETLIKEHPEYARGTDFQKLVAGTTEVLIKAIRDGSPHSSYEQFERQIDLWFATETEAKTHFIPCSISPYESQSFRVGPVEFRTLKNFETAHGITAKNEIEKFGYGQLLEYAAKQGAGWIAQVQTEGYDKTRSAEHADISVDIALVALQLFIPSSICKEVARSTARTIPPQIGTFHKVGDYLRVGHARADPCFNYTGPYFDMLLNQNRSILESVGNRVNSFVKGRSPLLKLAQAWCDAAYWFHEGLSEKLDTVAITKMETSIEVLLFAESTRGCKDRLLKTFESFYGLSAKQPLRVNDSRTVFDFIDSIVTARSRVLHGTWSTLNYRKATRNERQHRDEVELLARDLLTRVTLELDGYEKSEQPMDDFVKFLEWVSLQKKSA
ncbi:hypothetical protein [Paraburkholderia caribensis]|uniref:hypothetical protein n=1 Tax=Paraburkholderia caribensis TaxID=75105 RepID=UPI0015921668|nr:hypothetical protein [Paraburkholderia caribensis]